MAVVAAGHTFCVTTIGIEASSVRVGGAGQ